MKQTPELREAELRMAPGVLTRDGFLGRDSRDLGDILQADDGTVRRCGLTHQEIAAAMGRLTDLAIAALGAPVEDGVFEVCACEAMGQLPCPFLHPGLYYKTIVEVRRKDTDERMNWTALQVHLIAAHGFYEGKGSLFRLEPDKLAEFLGLFDLPSGEPHGHPPGASHCSRF